MILDPIIAAWKQATTEGNNTTTCPVRLGLVGTVVIYHAAAAWMVFGQGTSMDMAILGQYVQHMATVIGTAGAAIGVKSLMKGDAE